MPCRRCGSGAGRRSVVCSACTGRRSKRVENAAKKALDDAIVEFRIPAYTAWNAKFGQTKYRPDFVWALHDRVVILEIDEHDHRSYDACAEREREDEIRRGSKTPVQFVRTPELNAESLERLVEILTKINFRSY